VKSQAKWKSKEKEVARVKGEAKSTPFLSSFSSTHEISTTFIPAAVLHKGSLEVKVWIPFLRRLRKD
jgi:hypothetical protein